DRGRGAPAGAPRGRLPAAVLTTAVLQVIVPRRGRVPIWWLFPVLEVVLLIVLVARDPGRIDRRSETLRRLTILLIAVMTLANPAGALALTIDILRGSADVT